MPAGGADPNTPETGLLPALNPAIAGIGGLSVSPSGQEAPLPPADLSPLRTPRRLPLPCLTIQPGPDNFEPPSPPEGYPEALLARA